jgi:hypothetical protein
VTPDRRFRYLKEPLFVMAAVAYVCVRALAWRAGRPVGWAAGQHTDVLLLPVGMPVWLWMERRVGWRDHDGAPTLGEVGFLLGTWSLAAEVIAPVLVQSAVADPRDVVAYLLGAFACLVCWRHR